MYHSEIAQSRSTSGFIILNVVLSLLLQTKAIAQDPVIDETYLELDEQGFVQDHMILQRAWKENTKTSIEWTLTAGKRCTFDVELVKRNAGVPTTVQEADVDYDRERDDDINYYKINATFRDLPPGGPYEIHLIVDRRGMKPVTFIAENVMVGDVIIMNASPKTNLPMHPEVLALNAGHNHRIGVFLETPNQQVDHAALGHWLHLAQNDVVTHKHLSHFTTAFASFLTMQSQEEDPSRILTHVGIIPAKDRFHYKHSSVNIHFDWKAQSKQVRDAFPPSSHYETAYISAKKIWESTQETAIHSFYKQSTIEKRSGKLVEAQPPSIQPIPELWMDGPLENFPITVRGVLFYENQ